eukprot:SAG11_NODE_18998_length_476_cov_0.867374_2_plen_71_part_01
MTQLACENLSEELERVTEQVNRAQAAIQISTSMEHLEQMHHGRSLLRLSIACVRHTNTHACVSPGTRLGGG